jgi:hypothetical protein
MKKIIDPLAEILERHLNGAKLDGDPSEQLLKSVIDEYLEGLKSQGVHVPGPVHQHFVSDLREEIRDIAARRSRSQFWPSQNADDALNQPANKKAV